VKRRKIVIGLILAWALCMPVSAWALSLTVVGGQLMGAKDVKVGTLFYDVSFVEGTCESLFNGCNNATDFTFTNTTEADLASWALINDVLLDVAGVGDFDTLPSLTNGITKDNHGYIMTPFGLSGSSIVWSSYATNLGVGLGGDLVQNGYSIGRTADTTSMPYLVYAKWVAAPTPAPEPATIILLFSGLAGFAFMRHKGFA